MSRLACNGIIVGIALMAAAGGKAQTATHQEPPAEQSARQPSPSVLCIADPPEAQQAPAAPQGEAAQENGQKPDKPSVAKDVGSAVGGTAGQLAGAAVAGPIGAAAGGVVAERVGRAIGGLVKGDKKKEGKQKEQPPAKAKCVQEAPVR